MIMRYKEGLYRNDEVIYSEKGSRVIPSYVIDFPDSGGVRLKQNGEKPLYEMIQANLVNCDLQNVIESCVHSNQYAVVTSDNLNTMIQDFSGNLTLGELYANVKRFENTWSDLPLEVRESFNSDPKQFIRAIGTEDFRKKVDDGYSKFNEKIKKNMSTTIPSTPSIDNGTTIPSTPSIDNGTTIPSTPSVEPTVNLEV